MFKKGQMVRVDRTTDWLTDDEEDALKYSGWVGRFESTAADDHKAARVFIEDNKGMFKMEALILVKDLRPI